MATIDDGYISFEAHGFECEAIQYNNYFGPLYWQAFLYAHKDVDVSECAPDHGVVQVAHTAGPDMRRYRLGRTTSVKFTDSVSAILAITDFAQRAAEKHR